MADTFIFDGTFEIPLMLVGKIYHISPIYIRMREIKPKTIPYINFQLDTKTGQVLETYTHSVFNFCETKSINFDNGIFDVITFDNQLADTTLKSFISEYSIKGKNINVKEISQQAQTNVIESRFREKLTQYTIKPLFEEGIKGNLNICNIPDTNGLYFAYSNGYTIWVDYRDLLKKLLSGEWAVLKHIDLSSDVPYTSDINAIQYVKNATLITDFDNETLEVKYQYFDQIVPSVNATVIFYNKSSGCIAVSGNFIYSYYKQLITVNYWDFNNDPYRIIKWGYYKGEVNLQPDGFTYWDYLEDKLKLLQETYDLIAIPTKSSFYTNHQSIFTYMKSFTKKDIIFQSIEPTYYYVDLVHSTIPDQIIDVICIIPLEIPNVDKLQKSFIELSRLWIDLKLEGKDLPVLSEFDPTSENRKLETSFEDIHKNDDRIINRDKDIYDSQFLFYKDYPVRRHTNRVAFEYVINRTPKIVRFQKIDSIISEVKIDSHKIILEYHLNKHIGADLSIKELDLIQLQLLIQSDVITFEYVEHRNKFIATIMSKPMLQILNEANKTMIKDIHHDKAFPYLSCDQFQVFFEQAYKTYYEQFNYILGYQNTPTEISVFAVTRNDYFCADINLINDSSYTPMNPKSGWAYLVYAGDHQSLWWYELDDNGNTKWSYNIIDKPIKLDPYYDKVSYDSDTITISYDVTLDDFQTWTTYPYQNIYPINCEDNSVNFLYDDIILSRKVHYFIPDNQFKTLNPDYWNINFANNVITVHSDNVEYVDNLMDTLLNYNDYRNLYVDTDYHLYPESITKNTPNDISINLTKTNTDRRAFYDGSFLVTNPMFGYTKIDHTWPVIVIEHNSQGLRSTVDYTTDFKKYYTNISGIIIYDIYIYQFDWYTGKFILSNISSFAASFSSTANYYDNDSIDSADESTFISNGGTFSAISYQELEEAIYNQISVDDIRNATNVDDIIPIKIHKFGLTVFDKEKWENSGDDASVTFKNDKNEILNNQLSFLNDYTIDKIKPVYSIHNGILFYQLPDFIADYIINENNGEIDEQKVLELNLAINTDEIRNRCSKSKYGVTNTYISNPDNTNPTDKDLFGDEISCYGIADAIDKYLEENPSSLPIQIKYDVFALASEASVFCNLSAIKEKIANYTNNIEPMLFEDADNSFREAILNCKGINNITEAIEKIQELFPNEVEIDYDGYDFKIFEEVRDLKNVRTKKDLYFNGIEDAQYDFINGENKTVISYETLLRSSLNQSSTLSYLFPSLTTIDFSTALALPITDIIVKYNGKYQTFNIEYSWVDNYTNRFVITETNNILNKFTDIYVKINSTNRSTNSLKIEYNDDITQIYLHKDIKEIGVTYPIPGGKTVLFGSLDSDNDFELVDIPDPDKYRLIYCVKIYKFKIKASKLVTKSILKEPCLKTTISVVNEPLDLHHTLVKTTDENGNNYVQYVAPYVYNQYYRSYYYEAQKWIFHGIYSVNSTMSRDIALKFPLCRMLILYSIMYYLRIPENDIPRFAALMIDASKFRINMREDLKDEFEVIEFLKWAFNNIDLFQHYGISKFTTDVLFNAYNTDDQYYVLFQLVRLIDFYEQNCSEIICGQIEQIGTRVNIDSQDSNLIGVAEVFKNNITDKIINAKAIDINEINRIYKAKNYDIKYHKPTGLYVTDPYYHLLYKVILGLNTVYVDYTEYDIKESDWYIIIKTPELPEADNVSFIVERNQPTAGIYVINSFEINDILNSHTIMTFETPKTQSKIQYELYQQGLIDVELKELPYGYKILEMGIPVVIFRLPLNNTNLIREIHAQTIPSRAVNQTRFSLPEFTKFKTAGNQFTFVENQLKRGIIIRSADFKSSILTDADTKKILGLAYLGWDFYISVDLPIELVENIYKLISPYTDIYPYFERFDIMNTHAISFDLVTEKLSQFYQYSTFAIFEIDLSGESYSVDTTLLFKKIKELDQIISKRFSNSIRAGIVTSLKADKTLISNILENTITFDEIILEVKYDKEYNEVITEWIVEKFYIEGHISIVFNAYYGDPNRYLTWMNYVQMYLNFPRVLMDSYSLVNYDTKTVDIELY